MTALELYGLATLAALAAADAAAAFQVMIGQPLVCGWLAGCLLGQPALGLFIGVSLQLLGSRLAPVGATAYPDVGPGTVAGVAVAAALAQQGPWSPAPGSFLPPPEFAPAVLVGLLTAILTGRAGQFLTVAERRGNGRLAEAADRAATSGSFAGVERANAFGVVRSLLRGALVAAPALALAAVIRSASGAGLVSALPGAGGSAGLVAFWWFGVVALFTVLFRGGWGDSLLVTAGLLLGLIGRVLVS